MQSPSKISSTSASAITPAMCGLQGWADLPEGLLHSIVPLLCSFLDLFAFAGTYHSWHAAFSSYPSKSTLCTLFPPLVVQPRHISFYDHVDGQKLHICQVVDPANSRSTLWCQIPEVAFKFYFVGSSYGQLICGRGRNCLLVDVFSGAKVLPPLLPFGNNLDFYSGMLTAPLASANSHLLVCARPELEEQYFLLDWPIGSDSWSKLQLNLNHSGILQIVQFNGLFIAMDTYHKLYTLSLAPQLGLQEVATVWWGSILGCPYTKPWLVVCSGMFLIVDWLLSSSGAHVHYKYKLYRLDMSTEPATWVEVVKLENHALFIGGDVRSPAFSCMSPLRWGRRSNCLYFAHYRQPWVLHGLGDDADAVWDDSTEPGREFDRGRYDGLQPFWVYPSMFYSDGQ